MAMPKVTVYTTTYCPYCVRAKNLLKRNDIPFEEVDATDKREWLMERSGQRTVPQIWIGETHVGGSDDLHALEQSGELFKLLGR